LHIVHRDVSPQNVLVGIDGVARVLDFGVAKAMQSRQDTRPGQVKGKSSYMAPEQIRGEPLTQKADIFAAAVVFWEILTARRLFGGATEEERIAKVLQADVPLPSVFCPGLPSAVDDIVMKGLCADPGARYATAREMAEAIESTMTLASPRVIGDWVMRVSADSLRIRTAAVRQAEISKITSLLPPSSGSQPLTISAGAVQAEDESIPGAGLTDYTMGASSTTDASWWKDRRALVALGALVVVALVSVILLTRPATSRAMLPPPVAAVAVEPPFAAGLAAVGPAAHTESAESRAADPPSSAGGAAAPPSIAATALPERAAAGTERRPAAPRPAALPGSRSAGSAGARAFRPTEL
jgi:eukaryotic-like serine/threonine-protein kinase